MNTSTKIRRMSGIAILMALAVIFSFIGNYVSVGPVSFNLSLLPISIGAILYGPIAGALLGLINGAIVLTAPTTAAFLAYNAWATVLIVLLKTTLAGLISAFMFKLLKKLNLHVAIITTCLLVPLINTALFAGGCFLFFYGLLFDGVDNAFTFFCLSIVGWNFIFEISTSAILSPSIVYITKVVSTKFNIGVEIN